MDCQRMDRCPTFLLGREAVAADKGTMNCDYENPGPCHALRVSKTNRAKVRKVIEVVEAQSFSSSRIGLCADASLRDSLGRNSLSFTDSRSHPKTSDPPITSAPLIRSAPSFSAMRAYSLCRCDGNSFPGGGRSP